MDCDFAIWSFVLCRLYYWLDGSVEVHWTSVVNLSSGILNVNRLIPTFHFRELLPLSKKLISSKATFASLELFLYSASRTFLFQIIELSRPVPKNPIYIMQQQNVKVARMLDILLIPWL